MLEGGAFSAASVEPPGEHGRKCLRVDGFTAAQGKKAMEATLEALSQNENICGYVKFGPKSAWYRDDNFADVVFKVEWQAAVETGEILKRLHCHIWLTLHHYSQVQINMPLMQRMFKKIYNEEVKKRGNSEKLRANGMPYIQVKLLPQSNWAEVIRGYIHKGMAAS